MPPQGGDAGLGWMCVMLDGWLTRAFARCCSPSQGQIGQASLEKSEVNVRMGELQIVLKIGNGESDA